MIFLDLHRTRALALLLAIVSGGWLPTAFARSLIPAGAESEWRFFTGPNSPATNWSQAGFDDSNWRAGHAPLGYGATNLSTQVIPPEESHRPITTWIRREFTSPSLQRGEGLAILLCVNDGAVLYLNGREIARKNMPAGSIAPDTASSHKLTQREAGNYARIRVPMDAWHPDGKNVLAIEVHQAAANDTHCFFDLALKTVPPAEPRPKVPPAAQAAMNDYYKQHYVGPGTKIPDGYVDGGRGMALDAEGRARSRREILLVDRAGDRELARHLEYARSTNLLVLPPLERTQRLAEYIDRLSTPPGGVRWAEPAVQELTQEFADKPIRIGEVLEQGQAGVCRHRSLLFKLMADEAGLKTALVRGNYAISGKAVGGHAWNEIHLDDGRNLLVDVMHNGGKARFPALTNSFVIEHYWKPNNTPWYGTNAAAAATSAR